MTQFRLFALAALLAAPLALSGCDKPTDKAPAAGHEAMEAEHDKAPATGPAKIMIAHNWARPAAAGGNTAGYFHIRNDGGAADQLLSVESPIAAKVQIHQSKMDGGVMKMAPLADGVEIPAGSDIEFNPGGMHVMFIGLTGPLKAGDKVPVTLVFRDSGRIAVELPVQTTPAGHDDEEHHEH
ncbi:MAG: copper chaperone PCu(A)C [Caulobacter sp.]|nr:copper chaperone PCu(A)C [Caulobacter sp.]